MINLINQAAERKHFNIHFFKFTKLYTCQKLEKSWIFEYHRDIAETKYLCIFSSVKKFLFYIYFESECRLAMTTTNAIRTKMTTIIAEIMTPPTRGFKRMLVSNSSAFTSSWYFNEFIWLKATSMALPVITIGTPRESRTSSLIQCQKYGFSSEKILWVILESNKGYFEKCFW